MKNPEEHELLVGTEEIAAITGRMLGKQFWSRTGKATILFSREMGSKIRRHLVSPLLSASGQPISQCFFFKLADNNIFNRILFLFLCEKFYLKKLFLCDVKYGELERLSAGTSSMALAASKQPKTNTFEWGGKDGNITRIRKLQKYYATRAIYKVTDQIINVSMFV